MDAVLHDDCFLIPSPNAYLVYKLADTVSKWIKNNRSEAMEFQEKLLTSFDKCMPPQNMSQKVTRERIWTSYHLLCTSDDYISDCKGLLLKTGS